ncbi:recombinase family protein [Kitasatospora sp. YST-16]|uniref:recombinase family protein n=1 Tax=Kitasatospora sp. YST-16 TaxID=2998080 RepID=UPI002283C9BD|nr:recombinase family protein [Kitasatospora sp. YST-16]WAL73099.1 recombinase family protein [Kitasatospora sp. YST-16]WNW39152.1 recombinase family protein [Streptomyces sp. Li-HN-5-13]
MENKVEKYQRFADLITAPLPEREDRAVLLALGFEEAELRELGLWDLVSCAPEDRAEAYVRRSNKREDVTTLRTHVRDIVWQARRDGLQIRRVWFEQRSASKAYIKREEFDAAIQAMMDGISKTLYVWKTDRLSRRGMGQVGLLLDELEKRRSRIYSVQENLDSRTGRILFALLSERARDEVKDIVLRTQVGVDAHKAEGKWMGGPAPYGLHVVERKLRHFEEEYKYARPMAEQLLENVVPAAIAEYHNSRGILTRFGKLWTAQGVIALPHSPSWAGLVSNRERMVDEFGNPLDGYHRGGEPLMDAKGIPVSCGDGVITPEERTIILGNLAKRSIAGTSIGDRTRGRRRTVAVLSGFFHCPHCGGGMAGGGSNYRCRARIHSGPTACKGISTMRTVADEAIGILWVNHILSLSPDSPTIQSIARRWLSYQDPAKETRKLALSAALEKAASREKRLNKDFFIGGMDEEQYDQLRREVSAQIQEMKAELAELSVEADLTPLMDREALVSLWEKGTVEKRQGLLGASLKKVTITPGQRGSAGPRVIDRLVITWLDEPNPEARAEIVAAVQAHRQRQEGAELSAA